MDWTQIVFWLTILSVILAAITSLILLLSLDWRISLLALTLQYLGVFFLVLSDWSFEMAATKLIAGWISAAILGMAVNGLVEYHANLNEKRTNKIDQPMDMEENEAPAVQSAESNSGNVPVKDSPLAGTRSMAIVDRISRPNPGGRIVALLTALLVWLTVFSILQTVSNIFPGLSQVQALAGLLLIGMGLIQLGFSNRSFRVILGLLTLLSGFEIIYASIENSALVAGLLASVNLGIALVGAYLLLCPTMQEEN